MAGLAFPRHNLQRSDPRRAARPIEAMESAKRAQRSASSELAFPPSRSSFSAPGKPFSQTARCKAVASLDRYPCRKGLRSRRLTEGAIGVRLAVRRNGRPLKRQESPLGLLPQCLQSSPKRQESVMAALSDDGRSRSGVARAEEGSPPGSAGLPDPQEELNRSSRNVLSGASWWL